jgi:opacity protein-like surface antigen
MKKTALAIALAIASLVPAQAQDLPQLQTEAVPPAPSKMRFLLGTGLTFGGDTLIDLEFEDGDNEQVRSGGLVDLHAGVDYRINQEFSLQATVGYHVDNSVADNGEARFSRVPMELIAYYHVNPSWRVGAGARYVSGARLKLSGAAGSGETKFDNNLGGVFEAEWLMGEKVGIKLRYVREKYKIADYNVNVDGSHAGVLFNYYF